MRGGVFVQRGGGQVCGAEEGEHSGQEGGGSVGVCEGGGCWLFFGGEMFVRRGIFGLIEEEEEEEEVEEVGVGVEEELKEERGKKRRRKGKRHRRRGEGKQEERRNRGRLTKPMAAPMTLTRPYFGILVGEV